jgi:hypothetical protein
MDCMESRWKVPGVRGRGVRSHRCAIIQGVWCIAHESTNSRCLMTKLRGSVCSSVVYDNALDPTHTTPTPQLLRDQETQSSQDSHTRTVSVSTSVEPTPTPAPAIPTVTHRIGSSDVCMHEGIEETSDQTVQKCTPELVPLMTHDRPPQCGTCSST